MTVVRALPFANVLAVLTASSLLLAGACSTDTPHRPEGSLGETRAGATLSTAGFIETTAFSGHDKPTVVRFASDGRVFIAEKNGRIYVYDDLEDTTPTLFLDLQTRVHDFWDRGLLGMTLAPDFPAKPYVYVLYNYDGDIGETAPKWGDGCPSPPGATDNGCVISGRLSRFSAIGNTAGTETVLIEGWRQQYPSHATGQVEFGPDGALYASGGDGASFNFVDYGQAGSPLNPLGDPPVGVGQAQTPPSAEGGALRSQSVRRPAGPVLLNGAVVRVDPETGLGKSDNPLASSSDANAQRIIAYGLRNPFRIATRPGKSELWIADVGWDAWEELNRIPLGTSSALNFGWPCYEGAGTQPGYDAVNLTSCETLYTESSVTAPYFAYRHRARLSASDGCGTGSSSVTGIAFYDAGAYPSEYHGAMFFADYSRRCIYVMNQGTNGDPDPATARSFHVDADGPVFLTTGPGGDLFYAAMTSGTIQRIRYLEPAAAFTASPQQGQAPLLVELDGSTSVKALPEDVLSYAWDLDGDGAFDDATDVKPAYLYDSVGSYTVRLKVTDQRGTSNISAPLVIEATSEPAPTSTPPVVVIDTPSTDLRWNVGDTITFSGHATDAEDGELPPSALSWQVVVQHCPDGCHVHSLLGFDGMASGSVVAPDHDYPMYLELILTATDSSGQKRSVRRRLDPRTVSLVFDTEPSGLSLVVGHTEEPTPFARRVLMGSDHTIAAPTAQVASGGLTWRFASWSDGGSAAHTLSNVTAPLRYVARYVPTGGLTAQYFNDLGFVGTPLTRVDPTIAFDWKGSSPDPSLSPDTFSVRWTGELKADFDETYELSTLSDDGVRVYVDGALVIDNFTDHSATVNTAQVPLAAGWHPIVIEYYERNGDAVMTLSWSSPSVPAATVPETHLRPGCASSVCASGLNCNGQGLCVTHCDSAACNGSSKCELAGGCVPLCQQVDCPAGDKCAENGGCVDLCHEVTCAAGQHCAAGSCVDDPIPPGDGGAGGEGGAPFGGAGGFHSGGEGGFHSGGEGGFAEGGDGGFAEGGASGGGGGHVHGGNAGTGNAGTAGSAGAAHGGQGGSTGDGGDGGDGDGASSAGAASEGGDGNGGTGGSSSDGGAGTGAGATSAAGKAPRAGAGAGGGDASSGGDGCSCRVAGARTSGAEWSSLVGAALLLALGRRRRRS